MSVTVVVTRNVEDRYRGFLSSVMLEVSAGVYISPNLNKGARERIWTVMTDWHRYLGQGSVLMTWTEREQPGGVGLLTLGEPPRNLVPVDGLLLVRR
jgi:CRISPR-associated protein Cas2